MSLDEEIKNLEEVKKSLISYHKKCPYRYNLNLAQDYCRNNNMDIECALQNYSILDGVNPRCDYERMLNKLDYKLFKKAKEVKKK